MRGIRLTIRLDIETVIGDSQPQPVRNRLGRQLPNICLDDVRFIPKAMYPERREVAQYGVRAPKAYRPASIDRGRLAGAVDVRQQEMNRSIVELTLQSSCVETAPLQLSGGEHVF